jgi:hypothetical protein
MKKTITKTLKYTEHDYEMLLIELYVAWCDEHAYSEPHLQLLLTSQKLFNWFATEYNKRELQFSQMSESYIGKVSTDELRKIHLDWTAKIKFYPGALLSSIVKKSKNVDIVPLSKNTGRPAYNLN